MGGGGADLPSLNPGVSFVNQFQPQADAGAFNQIGQVASYIPRISNIANRASAIGANAGGMGQAGSQRIVDQLNNPAGAQYWSPNLGFQMLQEAGLAGPSGQGKPGTGNDLGLASYAQQALQTGFDPQQQLYNRTLQQVQQQTRAGLEARGLDKTPYGAGTESDALKNFNIDWQNTQQQRQQQGSQTASALGGLQNLLAQGGMGIFSGYNQANLAATSPILAGLQGVLQGQQGQVTAQQAANLPFTDYIQYLSQATNQNNAVINAYKAQADAAIANQQLQNQADQANMAGIGKLAGTGLGLFGGK